MSRDIDMSFTPHPITGDVSVRQGTSAILQSIRNIVMTCEWDVPFESGGWGDLRGLLGENAHPLLALDIQRKVEQAVKEREPRVEIVSVTAVQTEDRHGYNVGINFYRVNSPIEESINIPLVRIR